jgi:UDP-N-acetylglucosamine--N-acetylmuramyl-(pentapeptide) pyrophosphoryl-undecaprenol N-acetylglucosamine transferase
VPYPFAADDHQKKNAEVFVATGAAWMVEQKDLTPQALFEKIDYLKNHPEALSLCAKKAAERAVPDAAERVVQGLLSLSF